MAVIGIDLGGTKVAGGLFSATGDLVASQNSLLYGATGDAVGDLVIKTVTDLLEKPDGKDVDAIGICIPGIAYSKKGTAWVPNIPGWENYPLRGKVFDKTGIKVTVDSDRTCYILGEEWKGTARGCNNAIYLAVGTGIGAGILLDGHIIHGANDIVGATGWMALQPPYVDDYIPCGCFEHYASGNGIGLQARLELAKDKTYDGPMKDKPIDKVSSYDVFEYYPKGDAIAVRVLDKAILMWGMAIANLVSLFNPEKIIFGGGVFGPAVAYIDRIYAEACKWGQPISMREVKFVPSELEGNSALFGAARLAMKEL